MITEPPQSVVSYAVETACESPCAHSQRGVVIFMIRGDGRPVFRAGGYGFNGPPGNQPCLRTRSCAERCARYCVHAEHRALMDGACDIGLTGYDMLHVKVIDGKLVAGGGPSCLPCANAVLDAGIDGFWLYEAGGFDPPRWCRYTAQEFYAATVSHVELWRDPP